MRRVSYAPLSTMREEQAKVEKVATNRRKRLNKEENNWGLAIVLDLLLGIGPWVVGACALAVGLWAVHEYVPGAPEVFLKFSAPAAIAAVSTFSAFLLVNKIHGQPRVQRDHRHGVQQPDRLADQPRALGQVADGARQDDHRAARVLPTAAAAKVRDESDQA